MKPADRIFTGRKDVDGRREYYTGGKARKVRLIDGWRKFVNALPKKWEAWPEYLNGHVFTIAGGRRYLVSPTGWRRVVSVDECDVIAGS